MDCLKVLGQLVFILWALFIIGGTVIIWSVMTWQVLREIFKGE